MYWENEVKQGTRTGNENLLPEWVRGSLSLACHDILHVWIINDNEVHVVSQGGFTDIVYCYVFKREYTFTATRVH